MRRFHHQVKDWSIFEEEIFQDSGLPEKRFQKTKISTSFEISFFCINPLSANFTKWSNTLKQFVGKFPTNCLSVFDHFVGLALKRLTILYLTHDLASWQ